MRDLKLKDFEGRTGTTWEVVLENGVVPLTLQEVKALQGGMREDAFRLLFTGPADSLLPQAIHRFRLDGEEDQIFIVPIGRKPEGIEYEAIFY